MSPRELVRDWAGSTSMHAAAKSVLTDHPVRRHIWIVLLLTAWAVFLWQLTLLSRKYASHPKRVTVEVEREGVPFPSITLCNMRTLDLSTLQRISDFYKIPKDQEEARVDFLSQPQAANDVLTFQLKLKQLSNMFSNNYFNESDQNDYYSEDFIEYLSFAYKLVSSKTFAANIPEEVMKKAANKLNKFVALCQFENKNCNISRDFTNIFSHTFYTCFTYKSPERERQQRDGFPAIQEGRELGWSTVVFSGNGMIKDYDVDSPAIFGIYDRESTASGAEGVRVVIHPPDTLPLPETEGYDVPPGYSVSFDIRPKLTQRVDQPYGQCTTVNPFDSSLRDERYRKNECLAMCLQKHIVDKCGCIDSSLPYSTTDAKALLSAKSVSSSNKTTPNVDQNRKIEVTFCRYLPSNGSTSSDMFEDAMSQVITFGRNVLCREQATGELYANSTLLESCACYSPCKEFSYDVAYSLAKWPSTKYEAPHTALDILTRMNFLQRVNDSCSSEEFEMYDDYLENKMTTALRDFVRINVFSSDSSVIRTIESPDYLPYQLISDIGGQLGVWIGVSVLTLSEFFEMLLFILWEYIHKGKKFVPTVVGKRGNGLSNNNNLSLSVT